MKKTILTITLAIFTLVILLLLTITNISAIDRTIFLDDYDIEYSYTSAEEDETFTLTISITNTDQDDQDKTEVVFELDEKDPFNVKGDEEWDIGDLEFEETQTHTFRVGIDANTPEGKYDLEFKLDDADKDYDDELEIEVESDQADLIIGNVQTLPSSITPDEEDLKLDITIENLGSGDANFVRTKLILPQGFEASSSFSDYVNLGTIFGEDSADEDDESVSKTATFYINTDKDLESGTHQAQLEIEYKTGSEKRFQTLSFDLPVKGKPLFNIISTSTSPKVTMQGQPGQLSIQIQNIGEEKGQETSIRVFENSDLPIEFDQKTNFIGDLEKGEIGTAIFKFEVEEDAPVKEYLIKIQTRTLNNNNVIVEEYTIPLVIKAEEGTGAGAIIIMIPTILIILVGIFGIYRVKKRKNTINPNSKKTKTSEYY